MTTVRTPPRPAPPLGREWFRSSGVRLLLAAAAYTIVVLVPLFVILVGPMAPERGFWVEFGVALGFIGLAMLCLQSVLTARYPRLSATLGQDTMLQFHRQTGIVAFAFVLAHPIVLVLADPTNWEFLDPRVNFLRAAFLIIVLFALPTLIVTSLWREAFRLPYQWWRLGHGVLAVVILTVGLVHVTRVHHYLSDPWKQVLWVAIGSTSIASVLYVRALKPLRIRRHPYRVVEVAPVADRTWQVTLEPTAGGTLGFRAGQFAFVTIADSPFSLEQHPFSIASSADDHSRLSFAIKELGDFTDRIGELTVGLTAFVDGPYGSLTLPDDADTTIVMIAGGIGISPAISMLRTLRTRVHRAPVVLVYAADRREQFAYLNELDHLETELPLDVALVVREPPADWMGERGFVDAAMIARHLPAGDPSSHHVVLCGPPPMMNVSERALRDLGVPLHQIHSERFDIGAAGAVGERGTQVRRMVLALSTVMLAASAVFAW